MADHKIDGNDGAGNVDLIRRIDAMQACQVGPSDEWAKATKDGYNQAATDCAMAILRVDSAPTVTVHGWQPIQTAPKDGSPFLGCDPDYIFVTIWDRGNRVHLTDTGRGFCYPTHWMPLPAPPEA